MSDMVQQLVFPGFTFGKDDPSEAERLVRDGVGGFCLYGGSVQEVVAFTRKLQGIAKIPLLFCADYEDGTGSHVSGGTRFPTNMGIGATGDENLARRKAYITAVESMALGVRWVLAPVLDLATLSSNPIVNVRSFGADPALVGRMGRAYSQGLKDGGVLSCAKHFPGHGETEKDSHLELPVLRRTLRQLKERELKPFEKNRTAVDSVMAAHLHIPSLKDQPDLPASLSRKAIDGLLRRAMKFTRLVTTDALSMHAISDHFSDEEAAEHALLAGVDVLLVPANPRRLVDSLPQFIASKKSLQTKVRAAHKRLMKAKETCRLFVDRGVISEDSVSQVGCEAHQVEAERMTAASLSWIRKEGLPGKVVRYLEPNSSGPNEWQGKAFVEELRALGIEVLPYEGTSAGQSLITASFLRPKAYTGRIEFSFDEKKRAESAFAEAENSFFVAFGSPFVFDQLSGWRTGLCVYTGTEAAQKLAAWALVGRLKTSGRSPISIKASEYAESRISAPGVARHLQFSKTYSKPWKIS